jgi:hypothetical protein
MRRFPEGNTHSGRKRKAAKILVGCEGRKKKRA